MMTAKQGTLKGLQKLDLAIAEAGRRLAKFDPLFEELEDPVLRLEQEATNLSKRLDEIRAEERRLERAAEDKRARTKLMEDRLRTVRNLREEAAVHAEQDLLRRALDADEQEALALLDQIRRGEKQLGELEEALAEAQAELEPRRVELLAQRERAKAHRQILLDMRETYAATVDALHLRLYERIKAGGRHVVVADLTEDGACGHCFSLVPLQTQHEVRSGVQLLRCEGCGVILGMPDEGDESLPDIPPPPTLEERAPEPEPEEGSPDEGDEEAAEASEAEIG